MTRKQKLTVPAALLAILALGACADATAPTVDVPEDFLADWTGVEEEVQQEYKPARKYER
jgi:ABC-type glycerol-3-phosphate transport system substrate-binding protein